MHGSESTEELVGRLLAAAVPWSASPAPQPTAGRALATPRWPHTPSSRLARAHISLALESGPIMCSHSCPRQLAVAWVLDGRTRAAVASLGGPTRQKTAFGRAWQPFGGPSRGRCPRRLARPRLGQAGPDRAEARDQPLWISGFSLPMRQAQDVLDSSDVLPTISMS